MTDHADQPRLRLLLIEDDPDTALLLQEQLEDHFGQGCVTHLVNVAEGLEADIDAIDLVLSDMNLPDGSGTELLCDMLRRRPDVPVVFVTGEGVLDSAIDAIRNGAYDYIVKSGDYVFAIPLIVEKNVAIWKTKQENLRLQEQLQRTLEQVQVKNRQLEEAVTKLETMAATDPLTGLANRRAFGQAMEQCFHQAERHSQDIACIMIDLDGFKQLNDTQGHQCGDGLLQMVARVLKATCRGSDVAGRFGGDEFVVLLPQTDVQVAQQVGQRVKEEFERAVRARFADEPAVGAALSMSLGVTSLRHSRPSSPEHLIAHADHALYRAKARGKARIELCPPPQDALSTPPLKPVIPS